MAAKDWQTVWITGASSGIGRELAVQLARLGPVVAVSARSAEPLSEMARTAGAAVRPFPVDVTDRAGVAATVGRIEATIGPIDLAVLNAGIWQAMSARNFSAEKSSQSMAVNYLGIANALDAVLPGMLARGRGHVALVASVAGYRGLPKAAAYGPSKAAVISLAEALQPELAQAGITISVVNPGFVATPMTAVNTFPMPFLVPVEDAARHIIRALDKGRFEIAFPWQLVALLKLARVLPYPLFFWYARTFLARARPPNSDK